MASPDIYDYLSLLPILYFLYLKQNTLAGFGSFPRGVTHTFLSEGFESFGILPGLDCGFPLTLIIGLGKHQETS